MREIPLTCGLVALVDDCDFERVSAIQWNKLEAKGGVYAQGCVAQRRLLMHRFVLDAPKGVIVDHRNHQTLDNRRSNLRICNSSLSNVFKGHRPNKYGFRGVARRRSKYFGRVTIEGRVYVSAAFDTPVEAARAYDALAARHHGEFAVLNFPQDLAEAA